MTTPLLETRSLTIAADAEDGPHVLVHGLDLVVHAGEAVALVGESGSGKTMSMLAVMGLLPTGTRIAGGEVRLEGQAISALPPAKRRALNGRRIALVPQDAMAALNPTLTIGEQFGLVIRHHLGLGVAEARARTRELLETVGIPDVERRMLGYPHELSGGQRQRTMIALALACDPEVLIADEPTTALDVTLQQQILDLVARLRRERGLTVVWITHDLGVVAGLADRVYVLRDGAVVEEAGTDRLFAAPEHPYTRRLLAATPKLRAEA